MRKKPLATSLPGNVIHLWPLAKGFRGRGMGAAASPPAPSRASQRRTTAYCSHWRVVSRSSCRWYSPSLEPHVPSGDPGDGGGGGGGRQGRSPGRLAAYWSAGHTGSVFLGIGLQNISEAVGRGLVARRRSPPMKRRSTTAGGGGHRRERAAPAQTALSLDVHRGWSPL